MRDSRDKWTFIKSGSRPALTAEDVTYWKRNLAGILKVGMEFEFNLPDKNGSCHGNSPTCPCHDMMTKTCWTQCLHEEACRAQPEFKCFGSNCINFISACHNCGTITMKCDQCKHLFDPKNNPDAIRKAVSNKLCPNNSYGIVSKFGVNSITTDGSLLGGKGMEVITTGRRVDFWEFFRMSKQIIDESVSRGAYVNERCSIHMHLLGAYYHKLVENGDAVGIPSKINEMEKSMPEVIMANFHQLCRRYQNAITWLTMGLDNPKHMTRWEKYRVSILEISAILGKMQDVAHKVESNSGGNKYGWVNYKYSQFDEKGDVSRFHVELRVMDGILSPSIISAISCLYYALMIKAVEISRYGIMEIGDEEWMGRAKEMKNSILNNMKGWNDGDRFSDTHNAMKYRDSFIRESLDLIRQLKHILISIGPAYQILESLSERPAALRRCDGETWENIEKDLFVKREEHDVFVSKIGEIIDLRLIAECSEEAEWIVEVSKTIAEDSTDTITTVEQNVKTAIASMRDEGELIWSQNLGSYIKI
jgi:hypothetical protein